MSSSIQSRKDDIEAKKAKLAELKRQRELRSKDVSSRKSLGPAATPAPAQSSPLRKSATQTKEDLDSFISSLVPDRAPSTPTRSPSGKGRRASQDISTPSASRRQYQDAATDTQTMSFTDPATLYEVPVEKKAEIITYSKGVQTADFSQDDEDDEPSLGARKPRRKGLSPRERELEEEELRQRLRVEIEEELRALELEEKLPEEKPRTSAPLLAPEEVKTLTGTDDFLEFIDRSSKVIERALDDDYDVLADYALQSRSLDDENDDYVGRKGRRIKEIAQFDLTDAMGHKRIVSAIDFSPKFPELLCTSYTKSQASPHTPPGLLNVWNLHLKGRPEYSLNATSDLLSCIFHPYHPSLIVGGTYSGQLCLWDTRNRSQRTGEPVQKTPLTGGRTGHAHPVYSLAVVGTQNASSIISVSTDGVACAWSTDMLTLPQEYLELHAPNPSAYKTDDVAPTCISFPASDPTYFLAGTEQGSIVPVHRYDRAGSKAGIDTRTSYQGHFAPVTAIDFHPSRGKIDLGDLLVSAGMDWTVKIWRAKPPSTTSSSISGQFESVKPLVEIQRDDTVYDVRWSPTKPSVFGCVDGGGQLDIYDINISTEVPVSSARPGMREGEAHGLQSLNKLAWEKTQGKHVAVGGLDGMTTVFEVGSELGGVETQADAWVGVKKWVGKMSKSNLDV